MRIDMYDNLRLAFEHAGDERDAATGDLHIGYFVATDEKHVDCIVLEGVYPKREIEDFMKNNRQTSACQETYTQRGYRLIASFVLGENFTAQATAAARRTGHTIENGLTFAELVQRPLILDDAPGF